MLPILLSLRCRWDIISKIIITYNKYGVRKTITKSFCITGGEKSQKVDKYERFFFRARAKLRYLRARRPTAK